MRLSNNQSQAVSSLFDVFKLSRLMIVNCHCYNSLYVNELFINAETVNTLIYNIV